MREDELNHAQSAIEAAEREAKTRRGVTRWLIRETMGVVFVALSLFIPAGTAAWAMGWALVGLYAVWVAANALILIPRSPELLGERTGPRKGVPTWDTVIMSIIGLAELAKHILAGLDYRFGWTGPVPLALQIAALAIASLGYALGTYAMASNAFFSLQNRIQEERGHAVATGGPYRFVRHPGYAGTIAFELATPIMLGSLWALIPGVLAAVMMVLRTALEDRMLHEQLPGYVAFAQRTRYRLLPGVW